MGRIKEFDVFSLHERYLKGESPKKLAKEVGVHYATLINRFNSNNLLITRSKRFSVNHCYFSTIDNRCKSYYLGLIYADGNVHKNRLSIALQEEDSHILEQFKKDINFTGPVVHLEKRKDNHKNQKRLEISSKTLIKSLRDLGVIERKSNKLDSLPKIDRKFILSFVLGYFDGDGCVGTDKRSKAPTFSLVGNKPFLEEVKNVLDSFGVIRYSNNINECRVKGKFTLDYKSKRSAFDIYNLLYKNQNRFFHRKRKKFLDVLNNINTSNNRGKAILQYSMSGKLLNKFNTIDDVLSYMKISDPGKIYKCIRGVNSSSMGYIWKAEEYSIKVDYDI